jgi:hypothetical protein
MATERFCGGMTTGFQPSSPIACHPDMSNLPEKGYRTIGTDTQIPWPAQERIVCSRGRKFHVLPGSDALARMIRVQTCEGVTQVDADKLILELLSALTSADQAEAVTTFGNWRTAPLNIGKGPMPLGLDLGSSYFYIRCRARRGGVRRRPSSIIRGSQAQIRITWRGISLNSGLTSAITSSGSAGCAAEKPAAELPVPSEATHGRRARHH